MRRGTEGEDGGGGHVRAESDGDGFIGSVAQALPKQASQMLRLWPTFHQGITFFSYSLSLPQNCIHTRKLSYGEF